MELVQLYMYFLLLSFNCCTCLEPITTTIGLAVGAIGYFWSSINFKSEESCSDYYVNYNYSGLVHDLRHLLHGQHLVESIIPQALKSHVANKTPQKALVISLHGTTGVGKNYVSDFIAGSLFREGKHSKFIHLYVATLDFPHQENAVEYGDRLNEEIKKFTQECDRSLFIFDEVDKMPHGVLDRLKPFMDYYASLGGIDYRKNIFVFISNSGGSAIAKAALAFWMDGKTRSEIKINDLETHISKDSFNEKGGLMNSNLILRSLIDLFIPFLPLEREHVEMCIRDELRRRSFQPKDHLIDLILNEVEYYPKASPIFAESGCKRVYQKVDMYFE